MTNNNHSKSKNLAIKFLKDHKSAVVATASRSGEPEAATLFYAIDNDFTFNFITDKESRKYKNLKENPQQVALDCRNNIVENFNIDKIFAEKWIPYFEKLQDELTLQR